jgi:hypothetical protein
MDDQAKQTEVLVLTDGEGNLYVIPRHTLERHKLSDEGKAWLEKQMGHHDNASGYMHVSHGQKIVDRSDTTDAGLVWTEEMRAAEYGASANKPDTVSMLPITALTGLFLTVQDLSRYLDIPQSKTRLA